MTGPTNDTPATDTTATPVEAAGRVDAHLRGPSSAYPFTDPDHDPRLAPELETRAPDPCRADEPAAPRTRRGWPIETPTWQGIEI